MISPLISFSLHLSFSSHLLRRRAIQTKTLVPEILGDRAPCTRRGRIMPLRSPARELVLSTPTSASAKTICLATHAPIRSLLHRHRRRRILGLLRILRLITAAFTAVLMSTVTTATAETAETVVMAATMVLQLATTTSRVAPRACLPGRWCFANKPPTRTNAS